MFFLLLVLATLIAVGGAAVGLFLKSAELRRMEVLVHLATGALLGITAFDILPEAKAVLSWPAFLLACAVGFAVLWVVGKFVFYVCPSCAIAHTAEVSLARKGSLVLLATALGVHCVLDGLAITSGGLLSPKAEAAAVLAVGLHKVPEGIALGLVLAGARYKMWPALCFAAGVESLTILGGVAGHLLAVRPSPATLGLIFALVGGSFIYLVVTAMSGAFSHRAELPRAQTLIIEVCSFLATGAMILASSRFVLQP